jgi:hypothetical protein
VKGEPEIANTDDLPLPLRTLAGVMWMRTIEPPRYYHSGGRETLCAHCPLEGRCRDAVRNGNFVACEHVLKREIPDV